jgi:hypothetical protein
VPNVLADESLQRLLARSHLEGRRVPPAPCRAEASQFAVPSQESRTDMQTEDRSTVVAPAVPNAPVLRQALPKLGLRALTHGVGPDPDDTTRLTGSAGDALFEEDVDALSWPASAPVAGSKVAKATEPLLELGQESVEVLQVSLAAQRLLLPSAIARTNDFGESSDMIPCHI